MRLLLGIDTGGTFTDAVLVASGPDGDRVLTTAKAPTTPHDLAVGVAGATKSVLAGLPDGCAPSDIGLVSVSTTLATNALVEGHGQPVAVLALGFSAAELDRAGVAGVCGPDAVVELPGGHDAHGNERGEFPAEAVADAARALDARASAFAVIAQFSVRNPAHERRAADLVREVTGKPVTASHELTARLDGPRRALTAVLNARLLATIAELNRSVATEMAAAGIDAPLMVVRGDGSLVSAEFAARRPIETILSGPAASAVGALHLTGFDTGLVADIGGTTTDVAVVVDGGLALGGRGAVVGGWPTLVEAVDMATTGLGGDSEVRIDERADGGPIVIGPDRALPIGRLAVDHPEIVVELTRQADSVDTRSGDARFVVLVGAVDSAGLEEREAKIVASLESGPRPEIEIAPSAGDRLALGRLRKTGRVRVATFTPTDALLVLGRGGNESESGPGPLAADLHACRLAAQILGRRPGSGGRPVAGHGEDLAAMVLDRFGRASARFLFQCGLEADRVTDAGQVGDVFETALDHGGRLTQIQMALVNPVASIGALAASVYPDVARRLGTTAVVPEHAEVANAIGAVVGGVRIRRRATITQPSKGQFRVHLEDQPTFGSVDNARAAATEILDAAIRVEAQAAGGVQVEISTDWSERTAVVNDKEVFVEGTLTIQASGRPSLG